MMHNYMTIPTNLPLDYDSPPSLIPLKSLEERYHVISVLGNGSFGSVMLAKYRKNKQDLLKIEKSKKGTLMDPLVDSQRHLSSLVAIKTMNKKLQLLRDYTRVKEIKFILSIPSHPSLVQIYEIFIDDVNFQLHISMESMNQNLYQLMKSRKHIHFSPTTLKSILTQILHGINHIHKFDYFHRDVKPENILVIPTSQYYGSKDAIPPSRKYDNYVVKLADYGLARNIHNLKTYTAYVSTRWYRSPEILLRKKWYSKPVDIWAFGAVAVEAANFIPLFPGSNELDQTWRILKVLGSPSIPGEANQGESFFNPLGGYWKEAQILAAKLGFSFPYEPGLHILDILPDPAHNQLAEVVKKCLTWNPDVRPDVKEISSMPYFQDTIASLPYREPERLSNDLFGKPSIKDKSSQFNLISSNQSQNYSNQKTNFPGKNQATIQTGNSFISPNNNENYPIDSQFLIYDDLDDGYENEFMKSYVYNQFQNHPATGGQDTSDELAQDIDQLPSELKDGTADKSFNYYDVNYSDNNENEFAVIAYDSDQAHNNPESSYSWDVKEKLTIPRNIKAIKEPLEEEYNLIEDTSFGSEIKC